MRSVSAMLGSVSCARVKLVMFEARLAGSPAVERTQVNGLSLRPILPEPPVVRIEWVEPCLPRHLSGLSLIEMAVHRDFQEVDHEKPNKIVEPYEADEAPGNGGDKPAESRDARGQNLRAHYGGEEFPLGERRLEKE